VEAVVRRIAFACSNTFGVFEKSAKRNGWQDVPPISFWPPCKVPPDLPQAKSKLPGASAGVLLGVRGARV
jgi:hypothetical protein